RCATVTGVQTCALPISIFLGNGSKRKRFSIGNDYPLNCFLASPPRNIGVLSSVISAWLRWWIKALALFSPASNESVWLTTLLSCTRATTATAWALITCSGKKQCSKKPRVFLYWFGYLARERAKRLPIQLVTSILCQRCLIFSANQKIPSAPVKVCCR